MRNLKSLTAAALVFVGGLTGCYGSIRVAHATPAVAPVVVPTTTRFVYQYEYPDVWVDTRPIFRPWRYYRPRRLPPPPVRPIVHHQGPYVPGHRHHGVHIRH